MIKQFTTFEEQIEILEKRGLLIYDKEFAIKALQRYGYYNIINGYKDPYIISMNDEDSYIEDVTFEQIYSLYKLDRQIRNLVMGAMQEVEDHLKTATAHVIAEVFTADQNQYLKRANYRQGKRIVENGDYSIDALFNKFSKVLSDDTQPIKHYREVHGNVPPWILLKKVSFGNIVNFIKLQKGSQKSKIISLIYDIPVSFVDSNEDIRNLFMDTLFVCLDYRNRAAHGGRIYNLRTKSIFRFSPILHNQLGIDYDTYMTGYGMTGLPALCAALSFWGNRDISKDLSKAISKCAKEHYKKFPNDEDSIGAYLS